MTIDDRLTLAFVREEWLRRNPMPDGWRGTVDQWIDLEMPCRLGVWRVLAWWYGLNRRVLP